MTYYGQLTYNANIEKKKIQADVTFQKGYSDYLQLVLN